MKNKLRCSVLTKIEYPVFTKSVAESKFSSFFSGLNSGAHLENYLTIPLLPKKKRAEVKGVVCNLSHSPFYANNQIAKV